MERYQLSLYALNLPNKGGWFRAASSPYAEVTITSGPQKGKIIGSTEPVKHTLSPDWCDILFLEFSPAEVTSLEVIIRDQVEGKEPVYMGEANFEATSVYQEAGNTKSQQIGRKENSRVYCHIEKSKLGPTSGHLHLHLRGLDMKNVEPGAFGLGRSDPFFEVAKKNADYSIAQVKWNVVYRSKHIDNNFNPYWQPIDLDIEKLCYGKEDWPLQISVLDHNSNGKHVLIGETETTIAGLQERICVKGNADREQAIRLVVEGKIKTYGLLCVLKSELREASGGSWT